MREHDIITTSREISREGEAIPIGSMGTIIHVYKSKEACVVEFSELPENPIVTVYSPEIIMR